MLRGGGQRRKQSMVLTSSPGAGREISDNVDKIQHSEKDIYIPRLEGTEHTRGRANTGGRGLSGVSRKPKTSLWLQLQREARSGDPGNTRLGGH